MLRERRLRRPADFSAVYRRGRSYSNELLALRSLRSDGPVSRVGFAVGKRLGKAVIRNRVKRRLRAATMSLPLVPGWDIVISARPAAATQDYAVLRAALTGLLRRAQLLQQAEPGAAEPGAPPTAPAGLQKQV